MTTFTNTDRYIFAALRTVPERTRADLGRELRASIDDAVEARADVGEDRLEAERAVLTELGDPDALAAGYTDRRLYLIGPRYFLEWFRLVKILFAFVLPLAIIGITIGQVLSQRDAGEIVATVIASVFSVSLHLLFWPTFVFALLERNGGGSLLERSRVTAEGPWAPWTVDRLPELRQEGVGRSDMVLTLVFLGLGVAAIFWDRFVAFVSVEDVRIPVLDPDLWPWWIVGLFALMALEAWVAIRVYIVGRWTAWLAIANALVALAFAIPTIWLTVTGQLINPEFFPGLFPDADSSTMRVVWIATAVGVAAIAGWEALDGALKAIRGPRAKTLSV